MNKLFTKIVGAALGLAMTIGVGVMVGNNTRESAVVYAADTTITLAPRNVTAVANKNDDNDKTWTMASDAEGFTSSNSYVHAGSGSKKVSYLRFSTTAYSSSTISKIQLFGAAAASSSATLKIYVGGTLKAESATLGNTASSGGTELVWNNTDSSSGEIKLEVSRASASKKAVYFNQAIITLSSGDAPAASLSIDESKHLDYVGSEGFELTATASNYTPDSWTWTSLPSGVVSISNTNGVATVTPLAAGTTTITVSAPNGQTAMTQTCAVTVTSKSGANSSNPLTVDDAILIANYTGTTTTTSPYYMEGVVDSLYSSKYPMLQGTSDDLEIYKDCSGTVYAGDTIRVYGPIFTYENNNKTVIQPEFAGTSTVTVINIPVDSVSAELSTPIITGVTNGDLDDYLSVTVSGTNDRAPTNADWKVTNSSSTSVISVESDGKTFTSSSSVGTTTLTIASVADDTKTTTLEVTLFDDSIPVLQSVDVGGTPSKATQYVGQTFDWTGLTFTPVYSPAKKTPESITGANIEWNALVAGENPTGTYTGDDDVSVTVTVTSVTVEADGVNSVIVSGDMSVKTYDENASWNYTGLVVKVTLKSNPSVQVDPSSAVTWTASSTPKQLGVGTGRSVNVTATVGGVNSTAYPVIGITVTEHQADRYGLYSGALVEGDYVIVYDGKAMNTTVTSDRLQYSEPTISDNVISDPDSSIVWHIAQSGDYWTIYNAAANSYAAGTGAKNKAQMLADGTDNKSLWAVSGTSTYEFVNKANTSASVNANLRENGTFGFACYATSTGGALSLYKLNYLPKAFDHFNYVDGTPDKTSYIVGESFDPAGLEIHAVFTEPSIYQEENITEYIVWDALVEGAQATGTWEGHTVTITGLTISSFTPVTYTKLTSLDQLAVGSEVIIGGYKASTTTYYSLSAFDSNHFGASETTGTDSTLSTTSDTLIFTVEADRNGYYFKSANNYIKRDTNDSAFGAKDSDACWTISFGEEGAVTMTNGTSGNTAFQFNDSSPRFKNYAGTQKSVAIYVKTAADETDILKTYISRYLLLDNETLAQIPATETGKGGDDCKGDTGPYMTAKTALTSGEFAFHKSNFESSQDSIVKNGRLRYEAWARNYGDQTPYASTVKNSSQLTIFGDVVENGDSIIIVVISLISLAGIGVVLYKRKRQSI